MFDLFTKIDVNWMGLRRPLIGVSILLLLAGLFSAVVRDSTPGGTDAFNLGVDFKGGTVIIAKFKGEKPNEDQIRAALSTAGISPTDAVIQASTDNVDEVLIKVPLFEGEENISQQNPADTPLQSNANTASDANANSAANTAAVPPSANTVADPQTTANTPGQTAGTAITGRQRVVTALNTFGKEAAPELALDQDPEAVYKIVGTDYVGPIAGEQLRNQALIATVLGMVGILLFIAFRYDWTYAAGAVVAVIHDVLVTLAFFTIFQWEISLTVLAALLTLVGYSVNDSIVIFDRIRENLTLKRDLSLYDVTNLSINQTMSRTIVTSGLVFMTVLALVIFGGEVLRGFSLALLVGVIAGTYSTVVIASPIAIWWQSKLGAAQMKQMDAAKKEKLASASRRSVTRRPIARS